MIEKLDLGLPAGDAPIIRSVIFDRPAGRSDLICSPGLFSIDPALRASLCKAADHFHSADWNAWTPAAKITEALVIAHQTIHFLPLFQQIVTAAGADSNWPDGSEMAPGNFSVRLFTALVTDHPFVEYSDSIRTLASDKALRHPDVAGMLDGTHDFDRSVSPSDRLAFMRALTLALVRVAWEEWRVRFLGGPVFRRASELLSVEYR